MVNQTLLLIGCLVSILGAFFFGVFYSSESPNDRLGYLLYALKKGNPKYYGSILCILLGISLVMAGGVTSENYGYARTQEDEKKRIKNDIYQLDKF
jgi:hypothetical protein